MMKRKFSTDEIIQKASEDIQSRLHLVKTEQSASAAIVYAIGSAEGAIKYILEVSGQRGAETLCRMAAQMVREGRKGILEPAVAKCSTDDLGGEA